MGGALKSLGMILLSLLLAAPLVAQTDRGVIRGSVTDPACATTSNWRHANSNRSSSDFGKTWDFVSWIGPEPGGYSIMPSSLRICRDEILTTIRRKEGDQHRIEAWRSNDNGATWALIRRPAPSTGGSSGNPPSMIMLADGRLAITYGYRSDPFGIRARLSGDKGKTWGEEVVLRSDGGCWDLGYPRTVQRPDGKVVTVYYFNDHPDQERCIAATIWDPGKRR